MKFLIRVLFLYVVFFFTALVVLLVGVSIFLPDLGAFIFAFIFFVMFMAFDIPPPHYIFPFILFWFICLYLLIVPGLAVWWLERKRAKRLATIQTETRHPSKQKV